MTYQTHTRITRDLHRSKRFSFLGLLLSIAGAVVGMAIPVFMGQGPGPTLVGTVLIALLTSFGIAGTESGTAKGAKAVVTLLLAAGGVLVTVTGVTVTDLARGKSLTGDTQNTFPIAPEAGAAPTRNSGSGASSTSSPSTSTPPTSGAGGPDIEVTDAVSCGSPEVGSSRTCDEITVRSVGAKPLKVTSMEFKGSNGDEFTVNRKNTTCLKAEIKPGSSCVISVTFEPAETGTREARIIVHQNLPGPASEVTLTGGSDESGPGSSSLPDRAPPTH
ncbi:MAG: hypothetical protein ABW215_13165 [Kibdelosporangium sp.]